MDIFDGWWFTKKMKGIDKLEKENRKYERQIETLLKRTLKYWRKEEWKTLKPDYYLGIKEERKTYNNYGEGKKTFEKILVKYCGGENIFEYRTDDYDLILNTLVKLVDDKLEETKSKNHKLYWFLKDLKNLFFI